jgi:polysaccharide biosynthesis protein PslH
MARRLQLCHSPAVRRMKVLFLSPRQCWPPRTGAKLREYHLARALGRRASVTHISFAQPKSPRMEPANLPFCREVLDAPPPARYTPGKVVRGLLGPMPLPVLNYCSDEMSALLKSVLEREQFDLVHLESIHMAGYAPLIESRSKAPLVFDWHNIESEAMSRYAAGAPTPAHSVYARLTAKRLFETEQQILRKATGHVVCSAREAEQLKGRLPGVNVAVVENGADTRRYAGLKTAFHGRDALVFVGSMDYRPNIDAVTYFAREVWPLVVRRNPALRFVIVGSDPAPSVRALAGQPGIEVTGTVEDVSEYYCEALAAVVPLRMGGGTRLKILEAMAAGTPVVSTPLGAEGIDFTPDRDIILANRPVDWLKALNALAGSPERWRRLSCAGRDLVSSRYDWDVIGEKLFDIYCDWLAPGAVKQRDRRQS